MYIPNYFKCDDIHQIVKTIQKYPFGILISEGKEQPFHATHIPFMMEKVGEEYVLLTHLSAMNHHASLEENTSVMIVFNGPHGYVSPTNYLSENQVPTWDYIAIHVYGEVQMLREVADKKEMLEKTIEVFEPSYMSQWKKVEGSYGASLMDYIVAMKIKVNKIEATFKLSQNKKPIEIENIIKHFELENPDLAMEMRFYYEKKDNI